MKNVMSYKKPALWAVGAAFIAVVILCVVFAANPADFAFGKPPEVSQPVVSLKRGEGEVSASLNPAFYEKGFDFKYDALPALTLSAKEDILQIHLPEDFGGSVALGEDYYKYTENGGFIEKETYELSKGGDNTLSLPVAKRGGVKEEQAVYYLKSDKGTFVFKVIFP